MMDFLEMMRAGFKVKELFPDSEVTWSDGSGIMTIRVYVGIENCEQANQAREIFREA